MRALSARVLAKVTSSAVVGADVMVQVTEVTQCGARRFVSITYLPLRNLIKVTLHKGNNNSVFKNLFFIQKPK